MRRVRAVSYVVAVLAVTLVTLTLAGLLYWAEKSNIEAMLETRKPSVNIIGYRAERSGATISVAIDLANSGNAPAVVCGGFAYSPEGQPLQILAQPPQAVVEPGEKPLTTSFLVYDPNGYSSITAGVRVCWPDCSGSCVTLSKSMPVYQG